MSANWYQENNFILKSDRAIMNEPCVVISQNRTVSPIPLDHRYDLDGIFGHSSTIFPLEELSDEPSSYRVSDLRHIADFQDHHQQLQEHQNQIHETRILNDTNNNKATRQCGAGSPETISTVTDGVISYEIKGLHAHEFPVIGTYVDPSICMGFRYQVRLLGKHNKYQFKGDALHLQTIGRGYGKRLTFKSNHKNINDNFFWSDTNPNGYGFAINVVQPKDCFLALDSTKRQFAKVSIEEVIQQVELGSLEKDRNVTKWVFVQLVCNIHYTCGPHGLMPLRCDEERQVRGVVAVQRKWGSQWAETIAIEKVEIPGIGVCSLVPDS